MVDLEAIGKIPDSGSVVVRMCDDDYFVAAVDEFLFGLLSVLVCQWNSDLHTVDNWYI